MIDHLTVCTYFYIIASCQVQVQCYLKLQVSFNTIVKSVNENKLDKVYVPTPFLSKNTSKGYGIKNNE